MRYILALDQGTTVSRAILFDESGGVAGVAQREVPRYFPVPGRVEQDPANLWHTQLQVAEQVLHNVGASRTEVVGIGISNQRETTIIWERATGKPVHRAIVWQDRRTAEACAELRARGHGDLVRDRTGLVIDPYLAATKIRWILDNVTGARKRAEKGELAFGTVDSWLLWNLTGGKVHATDPTNASRTLLYNLEAGEWDFEMLKLFDIPAKLLPQIRDTSGHFAEVDCGSSLDGLPVLAMVGDQHAALFGQACFQPGMTKGTYGTGCFILMYTGSKPLRSRHRLLSTLAWQINGKREYALEGSVFVGGAVVRWLRDRIGVIEDAREIETLAAGVDNAGGVYFVPAFAGLGAPHWDAEARGLIIGLTESTGRAHLARAALEAIAYQCSDVLQTMREDSGLPIPELRVDGGAVENDLIMQFQADLMQVPVLRPEMAATAALGAAGLAGLAVGVWASREAFAAQWELNRRFEPECSPEEAAERQAGWQRALERAKGWNQT